VGDHVRIQNQVGNYPKKWDKTGVVIEVHQYHQYVIRVDGSGRITIRNRKFLRKYTPVHQSDRRRSILDDLKYLPTSNSSDQPLPTPTTVTDVPIIPNVPPPSNSSKESTPPSLVDPNLPTVSTIPPCSSGSPSGPSMTNPTITSPPSLSSGSPSGPSMTNPTITSPPSLSPTQAPRPEAPPQLPHAEPESSPINLRRSTRIRKPPTWQTSGDYILY